MHHQLIADAADAMDLTERGLFIVGLQLKRGMRSNAIAQTAGTHYDEFLRTGIAPEYMVDFAIDRINAERGRAAKRQLAEKKVPVYSGDDGA